MAEQAGVSHGLVRWHFGSRDGLVEATLVRSVDVAIATTALEPESNQLEDVAADLADWVENETELSAFQYECMMEARRNPTLMPHVRAMYDEFIRSTQRALEHGGLADDPHLARAVFAAFDGLALQQTLFSERAETDRALAVIHEMIAALRDTRAGKVVSPAASDRRA